MSSPAPVPPQPNPPARPFPFPEIPPPPVMPSPPVAPSPSPPIPPPEPPKPPTSASQPQPDQTPSPAQPSPPPASQTTPPPVIVTSVDTHIVPTIVTSTVIRITNSADGSSTSTVVGIDPQGSFVPIPTGGQVASSDKPAPSNPPVTSSGAVTGNTASEGMSNATLAMIVVIPIVVLFFAAIAVTLLRRRSDLKRYQGGIATHPRQRSQDQEGTNRAGMTQLSAPVENTDQSAAEAPLISVTPPAHTSQEQEYAPVPPPSPSPVQPNATTPAAVYLDPSDTGGYYQTHPPPSPTASTATRGSLFVSPGPPRVVDPNIPMLASHSGSPGARSSIPHRSSKLRFSTTDQDATESLVPGMDEGVQFSRPPKGQPSRLS